MSKKILIVDDDPKIAGLLDFRLGKQGYKTACIHRGREVLEAVKTHQPDLILLDIRMPDTDGVTVLKQLHEVHPKIYVMMISAHADVKTAVDCMKIGAYDLIEKPIEFSALDAKVKHIFKQIGLEEEVVKLRKQLGSQEKQKNIIGKSEAMKKVFHAVEIAAKSDANVLIQGESGTGKELIARAIHAKGEADKPFVAINCGAIPEDLLESELFGHEKGAFTGAVTRKLGKFEQASGGTIFLDEMGDLPTSLQVKLLRVLQEREIDRVGGSAPVPINVRFICATNKNLKKAVREGEFREDLYFRINVFPILLPTLRDRKDDIPELFHHLVQKRRTVDAGALSIQPDALKCLMDYHWPGNVRELENIVERLLLVLGEDVKSISAMDVLALDAFLEPSQEEETTSLTEDKENAVANAERKLIERALRESGGNVSKASKMIHVSRDTFYRKMKKYTIVK